MTEFEVSRMMMRHKKQNLVDRELHRVSKKEYEKEVMATSLAYLVRAFKCLEDIKADDDILDIMDLMLNAFDKADQYMAAREL